MTDIFNNNHETELKFQNPLKVDKVRIFMNNINKMAGYSKLNNFHKTLKPGINKILDMESKIIHLHQP
jgi:hypothetical protein